MKAWKVKGRDLYAAMGQSPEGKRKIFYGQSPEDASEKARRSYGYRDETDTLYGFYAGVYLPSVVQRSSNWLSQIGWAMDRYIIPAFGELDLSRIDRRELQRFFNDLPVGPSSRSRIRIVFSGLLNLAVADGIIPNNPCKFVRLPKAQAPEKRSLTFEELRQCLTECPSRLLALSVLLSFGLRIGEALGVTRAHIVKEQDGYLLQVRQQLTKHKGKTLTQVLKTPQSRRDIPIPLKAGEELLRCSGPFYLCSDFEGGALSQQNARRDWLTTTFHADFGVTFHELRHTFISLLENELEAPAAIVAALSGRTHQGPNAGYSHTQKRQMLRWTTRYWEKIWEQGLIERLEVK